MIDPSHFQVQGHPSSVAGSVWRPREIQNSFSSGQAHALAVSIQTLFIGLFGPDDWNTLACCYLLAPTTATSWIRSGAMLLSQHSSLAGGSALEHYGRAASAARSDHIHDSPARVDGGYL